MKIPNDSCFSEQTMSLCKKDEDRHENMSDSGDMIVG